MEEFLRCENSFVSLHLVPMNPRVERFQQCYYTGSSESADDFETCKICLKIYKGKYLTPTQNVFNSQHQLSITLSSLGILLLFSDLSDQVIRQLTNGVTFETI